MALLPHPFRMARKFFYDTGEQKVGPVTGNRLVQLRARGEINNATWVRRADSSTWRPLGSVDLRAEEEQEANPSLWRLLLSHFSWQSILLTVSLGIIIIICLIGLISFAWPLLLILFIFILLHRLTHS